ncbi:MAG: hypothetical protein F9K29_01205 [Hyphomicrobiaceae bacterium]|nr:MAG: hypothetical protein F9K29_01205 [Hyphomicrobiaceae bacterium]
MSKVVEDRERIREAQLAGELGAYVAPKGLFDQNIKRPFLGKVTCNVDRLIAGEWTEVVIDYEVGQAGLADGAWFKATFKFYSDWALFQTVDPAAANYVSAEYHAGPLVPGQSPATVQSLKVRFDQKGHERPFQKAIIVDTVDGYLNPGDHIVVRLGDRRAGGPGTRVQTFVEENFRFRCYVDPLGTSRFAAIPGDLSIDIVPGPPAELQIRCPRFIRPGTPYKAQVRIDDQWGNACVDLGAEVLLQAYRGGKEVYSRRHIFNSEGRQRTDHWAFVRVDDLPREAGELTLVASMPSDVRVKPAKWCVLIDPHCPAPRILNGELHCHAEDTVGINDTDYNIRYARDCSGLDFTAYTANDFQITEKNWETSVGFVQELYKPGEFVTFPTQEWCGSSCAGGDHLVVFLHEEDPKFPRKPDGTGNVRSFEWSEDMKGQAVQPGAWPLELLWRAYVHDPENHLVMPHVGGRRAILDWYHPKLDRLIEICSTWGHFEWLYHDAMRRGHRLGCYGGGDEHRGRPGGGAPGTQVFGVYGPTTGVICDKLDRKSLGKALRARHTTANTGPGLFGIATCGKHMMGDEFSHKGPAHVDYRFLGQAGWDEVVAFNHAGEIYRRSLQREAGLSATKIRVRYGGARIKDRYRWCEWRGTISVLNASIMDFKGHGYEHQEERCWRAGPTDIGFRSDTYGDSDAVEMDILGLEGCLLRIQGRIDGYVKVGNPLDGNPFVHCPTFDWAVTGRELMETGAVRRDLGGADVFLAVERLSDKAMPLDVAGSFEIAPLNGPHGHQPVFIRARQVDDHKVWTSAMFVAFE